MSYKSKWQPAIFIKFQALPRTVLFDQKTGSSLLQWPVDEVDKLRLTQNNLGNISLAAGSVLPLDVGTATQVA